MKSPKDPDRIVEVVMKKEMKYSDYQDMISSANKKGWNIQAYQVGFYQNNLKKSI